MRRVTLSTDRELVVLSAVQWRFGLCGLGFYECMVFLSTDRGLVVLRFCKGDEELRGATVC